MSNILPPGPGVAAEMRELLLGWYEAILQLQQPGAPSKLYTIAAAANLPPAADYPETCVQVTDKSCIAHSVETSPGTWSWLRADGTAL